MAFSMTGIGRASGEVSKPSIKFDVEIKSYNHRFLDISLKVPTCFLPYENEIRKMLQGVITRGHVIVVIQMDRELLGTKFEIDNTLLSAYLSLAKELKKRKQAKGTIDANTLLSVPGLIKMSQSQIDTYKIFENLKPILKKALDELMLMKEKEGGSTVKDIKKSLKIIEKLITDIKEMIPVRNEFYKNRLSEIQKDFKTNLDKDRFYQELLYVSDRTDVTEESERLQGHLAMFNESLVKDPHPGRRMNFILQEMQREANTLSVKANYLKISEAVVVVKEEIEKIREQVQNIE
ncbi:MAG TPA: YicC/YloC family endoribonuclease [bacterium]